MSTQSFSLPMSQPLNAIHTGNLSVFAAEVARVVYRKPTIATQLRARALDKFTRHRHQRKKRRLPVPPWLIVAALIAGGIGGYVLYDLPPDGFGKFDPGSGRVAGQVHFKICATSIRRNCVVDGDTIWFAGEKIRIEDIDTPEISRPKCDYEKALGQRAKRRLLELLNAGAFQVVHNGGRDKDRYGRLLRVIERDGQSLGDILIAEGLARRWDGARHPWC